MATVKYGRSEKGPGKVDLLISLTRRCQLRCRYCCLDFARKPPDISRAHLDMALRLGFASRKEAISIQLFGGEPVLRPELVRHAVLEAGRLAAERGKEFTLCVTSNMLALDRGMLEFFAEHGVVLLASLDGRPDYQRFWRALPGGGEKYPFAKMAANARLAQQLGLRLRVNMVVVPEAVERMVENQEFLRALGFEKIQCAYALYPVNPGWDEKNSAAYLRGVETLWRRYGDQDFFFEPVLTFPQVFFDTDGTVSICAAIMETSAPELCREFRIGRIEDFSTIDGLRRTRAEQLVRVKRLIAQRKVPPFVAQTLRLGEALKRLSRRLRQQSDFRERV
jgi:sulfatase maturation enzyme AslB (radical SAM superfamily)